MKLKMLQVWKGRSDEFVTTKVILIQQAKLLQYLRFLRDLRTHF